MRCAERFGRRWSQQPQLCGSPLPSQPYWECSSWSATDVPKVDRHSAPDCREFLPAGSAAGVRERRHFAPGWGSQRPFCLSPISRTFRIDIPLCAAARPAERQSESGMGSVAVGHPRRCFGIPVCADRPPSPGRDAERRSSRRCLRSYGRVRICRLVSGFGSTFHLPLFEFSQTIWSYRPIYFVPSLSDVYRRPCRAGGVRAQHQSCGEICPSRSPQRLIVQCSAACKCHQHAEISCSHRSSDRTRRRRTTPSTSTTSRR